MKKFRLWDIPQNSWPVIFQNVTAVKDKQNKIKQNVWVIDLDYRRLKSCDNQMQHVTLDWIPGL